MIPLRSLARLAAAAGLGAALAACGASSSPGSSVAGLTFEPSAVPSAVASSEPSATATGAPASLPPNPAATESLTEPFPRDLFSDPTTVDNEWFPLPPGTRWTWEGEVGIEPDRVAHSVVFTVTDLVKEVDGVLTVVGLDQDFLEGELAEAEIAFWAQDDNGTVWHLGQYPEVYEHGVLVEAPAWIAGIRDARAGISMKLRPNPLDPSYSQGWGPEVGWTDRARVLETGSRTCVAAGCYTDVLVIDEFNRDEPDAHQLKYYARGVGGVRVGWAGALEADHETLELVSIEVLSAGALAEARRQALALEANAYRISPAVYGQTAPATLR